MMMVLFQTYIKIDFTSLEHLQEKVYSSCSECIANNRQAAEQKIINMSDLALNNINA